MTPEQEIANLKATLREVLNLASLIVGDMESIHDQIETLTAPPPNPNMPAKHFLQSPTDKRKQKLREALQKLRDTVR